jgi:hypothetical protein
VGFRAAAVLADFSRYFQRPCYIEVDYSYASPVTGKRFSNRSSNAAGAASDNGDLSI